MTESQSNNERRINMAVALSRIEAQLKAMEKYQDTCFIDRTVLFKRIRQVDTQISKLETKQKIITWVGGAFTLTGLGVIGKWISSHIKA